MRAGRRVCYRTAGTLTRAKVERVAPQRVARLVIPRTRGALRPEKVGRPRGMGTIRLHFLRLFKSPSPIFSEGRFDLPATASPPFVKRELQNNFSSSDNRDLGIF